MAKLYFSYSAMNAGKSAILLQAAHNYNERGQRTLLMKPATDTRDAVTGKITSRVGLSAPADVFDGETDLTAHVLAAHAETPIACVLVDEAQFLTEAQVWQLAKLADAYGLPVMCYGLRTDFLGALLRDQDDLLVWAQGEHEFTY